MGAIQLACEGRAAHPDWCNTEMCSDPSCDLCGDSIENSCLEEHPTAVWHRHELELSSLFEDFPVVLTLEHNHGTSETRLVYFNSETDTRENLAIEDVSLICVELQWVLGLLRS